MLLKKAKTVFQIFGLLWFWNLLPRIVKNRPIWSHCSPLNNIRICSQTRNLSVHQSHWVKAIFSFSLFRRTEKRKKVEGRSLCQIVASSIFTQTSSTSSSSSKRKHFQAEDLFFKPQVWATTCWAPFATPPAAGLRPPFAYRKTCWRLVPSFPKQRETFLLPSGRLLFEIWYLSYKDFTAWILRYVIFKHSDWLKKLSCQSKCLKK